MPRVPGCEAVYEVADQWRERCLVQDKSLLWPDLEEPTWSVENLELARDVVLALRVAKSATGGDYETAFSDQSTAVRRCIGDAFAVFYLFPGDLNVSHKIGMVQYSASWSQQPYVFDLVEQAIKESIGAKEGTLFQQGFQLMRHASLALFLETGRRIKAESVDILDHRAIEATIKDASNKIPGSSSGRNMLLHLLFPEEFEPIFNDKLKARIASAPAFSRFASSADADERLRQIRIALSGETPNEDFNFFDYEVLAEWRNDGPSRDRADRDLVGSPIKIAFNEFAALPQNQLTIAVRRVRSMQLRSLLGRVQGLTLEDFNDDIWPLEVTTTLVSKGESLKIMDRDLDDETVSLLADALSDGDLRLRGNYIWRPSTGIFAPMIDQNRRAESLQTALEVLNDDRLEPVEKARQISDIPGFGISTASGLVMTKHPEEFAIYNKQSIAGVKQLGMPADSLEAFQDSVKTLKEELAAPDFLELDWFLYLIANNRIDIGIEPPVSETSTLQGLVYLNEIEVFSIQSLLENKKQLIFEGPPGSGKTFIADKFARFFTGNPLDGDHDDRIELVQFHQSYGYEDFVQGIRPETSGGQLTYHVQPGIFLEMCERAESRPDETFVLIIDEINRGNLSRIFGELLMALEYRDKPVRLANTWLDAMGTSRSHLRIPDNLFLIGTMNSTDRSLAMIDYALRRRFYFYPLRPVVGTTAPVLERWLQQSGIPPAEQHQLLAYFIDINRKISNALTDDYQIGHSYFMREQITTDAELRQVWEFALKPLLHEYFHTVRGGADRVEEFAPWQLRAIGETSDLEPHRDGLSPDEV